LGIKVLQAPAHVAGFLWALVGDMAGGLGVRGRLRGGLDASRPEARSRRHARTLART
jgi:hypothetical protein